MTSTYIYLYEYIPASVSDVTPEQSQTRAELYEFKEGICSDRIKNDVAAAVRKAVGIDDKDYTVCFVPAARTDQTISRYADLAEFLGQEFEDKVFLNTLSLDEHYDEFLEEARKICCDKERVRGKRVIFISDIYNTGQSYHQIVSLLDENGADEGYGIFIAKVIRKEKP